MNLHEKVLSLASEISERFVPAPTSDDILSDVLIGLKRCVFSLRWKEFFRLKKIQEEKKRSLFDGFLDKESERDDNLLEGKA